MKKLYFVFFLIGMFFTGLTIAEVYLHNGVAFLFGIVAAAMLIISYGELTQPAKAPYNPPVNR